MEAFRENQANNYVVPTSDSATEREDNYDPVRDGFRLAQTAGLDLPYEDEIIAIAAKVKPEIDRLYNHASVLKNTEYGSNDKNEDVYLEHMTRLVRLCECFSETTTKNEQERKADCVEFWWLLTKTPDLMSKASKYSMYDMVRQAVHRSKSSED